MPPTWSYSRTTLVGTPLKAIGYRGGITEKVLDAIVGYAPPSTGRGYGPPTLANNAKELQKFLVYKLAK